MPLEIVRNDITEMKVDVVVNSAHPTADADGMGGADAAIHRAAGPELLKARREIGDIAAGDAYITPAFRLPAKYVVHTAGPIWQDGRHGERERLAQCYENALRLAVGHHCRSIAFPLISALMIGGTREETTAIRAFLADHELHVYLVVFDRKAFRISSALFGDVQDYLDRNYLEELYEEECLLEEQTRRRRALDLPCLGDEAVAEAEAPSVMAPRRRAKRSAAETTATGGRAAPKAAPEKTPRSLSDLLDEVDDTFSQALLRLISAKGKTDPEIYKRANIDRKHFAKIRKNPNYQPGKSTALALAIALELNLDETKDLIGRAGYALSHSNKADIIVEYFIEQAEYDIFTINETLFAFGQPCLGA